MDLRFALPALGVLIFVGCIAAMIAIRRRKPVALLAVVTGASGIVFFSGGVVLAAPGMIVSLVILVLGAVRMMEPLQAQVPKIRGRFALSDSGVWRMRAEEYLSDSGHWRRAS